MLVARKSALVDGCGGATDVSRQPLSWTLWSHNPGTGPNGTLFCLNAIRLIFLMVGTINSKRKLDLDIKISYKISDHRVRY